MHPYVLDNYSVTALNTCFEVIFPEILVLECGFRCTRTQESPYLPSSDFCTREETSFISVEEQLSFTVPKFLDSCAL
jgi:hypothetical protein